MTLSVCSTCRGSIPADVPHCPRCGPQSLTLLISEEVEALGRPDDPDVARRLARALGRGYEIGRLLGRGGFAEVYEVRDTDLQRRLAVKVLRPDLAWTTGMLARFKQEARAIARLSHPHTVPIHFVGEGDGLVFYVMPFIEGQTLGALLQRDGALEVDRALAIAGPILEALSHAHRHGLVHRDIKPDNILIETRTGRPLLVDFGIAKSLDGNGHQTLTGFVVGTPMYMSPEQALGQRAVDARTDIYAIGAVLFQMLTGAPPFDGQSSQEIVNKHLQDPVPVPCLQNQRIPRWLSDVVLRCLAKAPNERYRDVDTLLEAIARGRREGTPEPYPLAEGPTEPMLAAASQAGAPRRRPSSRWLVVGAVGLAVAGIGTAVASRPHPVFVVQNRLVEPVAISVNGAAPRTIAPGDSLATEVGRNEAVIADWRLLRPVSRTGEALGQELGGRLEQRSGEGGRRYIEISTLGTPYFAPLVSNRTGRALRLRVDAGQAGAPTCDCPIPIGAENVHVGYYPLTPQSAVELADAEGRITRITDVATRAARENGAVSVAVAATALARPALPPLAEARPRRAHHAAPDTTGTDSAAAIPAPRAPVTSLPADTAHATPPKPDHPTSDDPLRGIFPRP